MSFREVVDLVATALDAAGVAVILAGIAIASVAFVSQVREVAGRVTAYRRYRQGVGRAILLGLEFLVAADIIRTVAVPPTFRGVGVLALIVAIRTFLSITLEVELEGRWPWQRPAPTRPDGTGA